MAKVSNNDELNDAMKRGESRIEIEGDLAKKVVRIKAAGGVAWALAIGAIGVAVIAIAAFAPVAAVTGGTAAPAEAAVMGTGTALAMGVLGVDAAMGAIALAVAAGGVAVLTRLRSDYKIVEQGRNSVVLVKV